MVIVSPTLAAAARRSVRSVAEQVVGLHDLVDFARALVNDRALAIAIEAPDRVFVRVAIGAMNLHGVTSRPLGGDRGNHFANPVSRVLRRPSFFSQPARCHSSRDAW